MFEYELTDAEATENFAQSIAKDLQTLNYIALQGDLGAGKTTFVRGFLTGLGHTGKVKSPTYNLVEEYFLNNKTIYHFDLYRLNDPEELEVMGIRDYFLSNNLCLIEWPEKAGALLPEADLIVKLEYEGEQRRISLNPNSDTAHILCNAITIK